MALVNHLHRSATEISFTSSTVLEYIPVLFFISISFHLFTVRRKTDVVNIDRIVKSCNIGFFMLTRNNQ